MADDHCEDDAVHDLGWLWLQDVIEIMKESLYDKYVDDHGFVDFGRSGGMSQQKEAKRFLSALNKQSELQQKDCFSISVSSIIIYLHKIQKTLLSFSDARVTDARRYTAWPTKSACEFPTLIPLWRI